MATLLPGVGGLVFRLGTRTASVSTILGYQG